VGTPLGHISNCGALARGAAFVLLELYEKYTRNSNIAEFEFNQIWQATKINESTPTFAALVRRAELVDIGRRVLYGRATQELLIS
jgi:hypothetical protein